MKNTGTLRFNKRKIPWTFISNLRDAKRVYDDLTQRPKQLLGFDTETCADPEWVDDDRAALNPLRSHIRLVQLFDGEQVWVFDCHHLPEGATYLRGIFYAHRLVAHYALFDLQFLMRAEICPPSLGCTFLIFKLLLHAASPVDDASGGLADLSKSLLGEDLKKGLQDSDWGKERLSFEQLEYAAKDPVAAYDLATLLAPRLKQQKLERIYALYRDAQYPIAQMMLDGIRVDKKHHLSLLKVWRQELLTRKKDLQKLMPRVNVNSGPSIGEWLEKKLPPGILNVWPRTPTGRLKTDANTFSEFAWLPFVGPMHEYQSVKKLTSTYGMKLLEKVNRKTSRLHGKFSIGAARTGRMTASEPNLQNLPRRKDVRESFVARKGWTLLRADFNQIEVRVAAEISRDPEMLRCYEDGIDVHKFVVAHITGKRVEDVTEEERQFGKALNFGLLFGIGAAKMVVYAKKGYGVEKDEEEMAEAKRQYFEIFEGYRSWMKRQAKECEQSLYCYTASGKKRRLQEEYYYGQALNTPIQGSAAECMMHAIVKTWRGFHINQMRSRIVNVVHDEVLVEAPLSEKPKAKEIIEGSMIEGFLEVFPNGTTRGLVAVTHGKNWAETK